jgi:polysaccharide export outer membrane protein
MINMKLRKLWEIWFSFSALALAGFLVVSCGTTPVYDPPSEIEGGITAAEVAKLRIGDTVKIDFSSFSERQIQPHEEQIKDDGTITLPYVGEVEAAGKTTGELQKILQKAFERYFQNMTVTVKAPDRYYSVGGQVKLPNRQVYVGGTTIIKAIQSAGDLTDFANRKKIQLTRANGKTYIINYDKALRDPKLDLPVYPGDSIHVPQRLF